MGKIKETITALIAGEEPGAVHINRKEREPMPDRHFEMVLQCIVIIALIVAGTVLILNAGIVKLASLFAFGIFFCLIYFDVKN